METINIVLDSDSEHRQCRLTNKYLKWKKIKLQHSISDTIALYISYII